MMKTKLFKKLYFNVGIISFVAIMLFMSGCSDTDNDVIAPTNGWTRCELILQTDANDSRATVISDFPDSAILHIKLEADKTVYSLTAEYSKVEDKWTIDIPEDVLGINNGTCHVFYADKGSITATEFGGYDLERNTSIMATRDGEWGINNNVMYVGAALKPILTRIRFVNDSPTEIWVKGFGLPSHMQNTYTTEKGFYFSNGDGESSSCYPKFIKIDQQGNDGRYYSEYYHTNTIECYGHKEYGMSYELLDCPENKRISIYNPTESLNLYYYKSISELQVQPGESYLISLPKSEDNGWVIDNNFITRISSLFKIGGGENMDHTFDWNANRVIYGQFINFDLSNNGGNGYIYISGTTFSYNPTSSFSNKQISAIYNQDYGLGGMTFGFNVSSLSSYYTTFFNVTLTHFPYYTVWKNE